MIVAIGDLCDWWRASLDQSFCTRRSFEQVACATGAVLGASIIILLLLLLLPSSPYLSGKIVMLLALLACSLPCALPEPVRSASEAD